MPFHFKTGMSWSVNLARNSAIADLMAGDSSSSSSFDCAEECSSSIGSRRARDLLDRVVHEADVLRIEQHRAAFAHLEGRGERTFGVSDFGQADEVVFPHGLHVLDLGGMMRGIVIVGLDRLA